MSKKIEEILIEKDFSEKGNRDKIYADLKKKINDVEVKDLTKKRIKFKPVIAACLMLMVSGTVFSKSTLGKELYYKVLRTLNLSNSTIMLIDSPEMAYNGPVPEFLKGKLFDKDGNEITEFNESVNDNIYNEKGEKIVQIRDKKVYTQEQLDAEFSEEWNIFYSKEEAEKELYFQMITPKELPENYEIKRWEVLKATDKYANLVINNTQVDESIIIFYRYIDETTSWATDSKKAEELKINGHDAILADDNMLMMDIDGVNICVMVTDKLKKKLDKETYRADLLKIAEELK